MQRSKIPHELGHLAPFFHDIDLGNGYNTAPETNRMKEIENMFFPVLCALFGGDLRGRKILDVGCNCGGFSFAAIKYGAKEVTGVDSDPGNIEQANMIRTYLGVNNAKFIQMRAEDIDLKNVGEFDITIVAGLLYHLSDPLGVVKRISAVTKSVMMVDSHVHYSSDTTNEDMPSWWMLTDTDKNDFDGLFVGEKDFTSKYLNFEKYNPIDYSKLPNQFVASPHTSNDMKFISNNIPQANGQIRFDCNIGSATPGELVLIPNKKALIRLIRSNGFEDIVEIIPQRFASIPYISKYRIGLFAIKRKKGGKFPISILHDNL